MIMRALVFYEGNWFQFRNGDSRQLLPYSLHSDSGWILETSSHRYFIGLNFRFWSVSSTLKGGISFGFWRTPRNGIFLEACWVFIIQQRATLFFDLSNLVPIVTVSFAIQISYIHAFIHSCICSSQLNSYMFAFFFTLWIIPFMSDQSVDQPIYSSDRSHPSTN